MSASLSKTCYSCQGVKPLADFTLRKDRRDGRAGICKPCHNAKSAAWRARNPEKSRAIAAEQNIRRKPYRAFKKAFCEKCSFVAVDSCQLHVDHINGDHSDNRLENLQTLCANCHALKSKQNGDVGRPKKDWNKVV